MAKLPFVGRQQDLAQLERHLDAVTADGTGRLLSVRGRRQAGKSRLVTEFAARSGLPQLFFTGSRQASLQEDLARFTADVARESNLPGALSFEGVSVSAWEPALRLVAAALPDGPAIVVLDEFPWLLERDTGLEGTLQKLWDTVFEARPVLFVLIGSDLSMMEALSAHDRPLYGRAKEVVVEPFHPADTAAMLGIADAGAAIDAYLVTGGYPRLLVEWRRGRSMWDFVAQQLSDENSDLVVVAQRVLSAEFPVEVQARSVLGAIGSGERTFKGIGGSAGIQATPLSRALRTLRDDKRVVAMDLPMGVNPPDEPRYRIADPYLRFWLRFVESGIADIARGRPDLAISRVREWWNEYRGRAVEPIVRQALGRLAASNPKLGGAAAVGGYWTRTNDPEVDVVGVDRFPNARRLCFVGSIKWKEPAPFNSADLNTLLAVRSRMPNAEAAPVIAVSRSQVTAVGLDATFGPGDLLSAWS